MLENLAHSMIEDISGLWFVWAVGALLSVLAVIYSLWQYEKDKRGIFMIIFLISGLIGGIFIVLFHIAYDHLVLA